MIQRGISGGLFDRQKQFATWGATGAAAETAKSQRANLAQSGMLWTPGVAQAAQNRLSSQTGQQIGQLGARYDVQGAQFGEQRRQFDEQLAFARKQWEESKTAAEKAFWGQLYGSLISAGGAIVGGMLAGPPGAIAGSQAGRIVQ